MAVIVPFPVPEDVTVHQVWSLPAVQDELDVTVKDVIPATGVTFWFGGVTESVGVAVVNCRSLPYAVPALLVAYALT